MHRITALKPQKKGPQRVNVYLDGKYAFALDAALAAALKVGQVLPPNDQAVLGQRDAVEVAYNKVLGFLSYRPRSGAEVATYLRGRQVPAEIIDGAIDRLQRAGLLDDDAFAHYWVENREQFRPRGARALRSERSGSNCRRPGQRSCSDHLISGPSVPADASPRGSGTVYHIKHKRTRHG